MANWYGTARSNYFRVKDADKFKAWVESIQGLGMWERTNEPGLFGIYSDDGDSGGWPSWRPDDPEYEEVDLVGELVEHLAEGEVAILMEAGAEKLRYISGYAIAVNHKGEQISVSLADIYQLARATWGIEPTDASY